MKTENEMEDLLRGLRLETPRELDENILKDAFAVLTEAAASESVAPEKPPSRRATPRFLKFLFGTSLRKIAVAGATCAACVALLILFGMNRTSLAGVVDAVEKQPWLHIKYDTGSEEWAQLQQHRFFWKTAGVNPVSGQMLYRFWDEAAGIEQIYEPVVFKRIAEHRTKSHVAATTPWQYVVSPWDTQTSVEKHSDTLNGKPCIRFDVYSTDALGDRILERQLWADPATRLPVMVRARLDLTERESFHREYTTGEYDYPAAGPASIFDLGVPREVQIATQTEKSLPDPRVEEIMRASQRAQARFDSSLPNRRVVTQRVSQVLKNGKITVVTPEAEQKQLSPEVWQLLAQGVQQTWVAYRKGAMFRVEQYGCQCKVPESCKPGTKEWAQAILPQLQMAPPLINMFDGELRYYWQRGYLPDGKEGPATVQVGKKLNLIRPIDLLDQNVWPVTSQWAHLRPFGEDMHILAKAPDMPAGCVALTYTWAGTKYDYYIDAEHDYICFRSIWSEMKGDSWQIERDTRWSGFVQLLTGQWYASEQRATNFDVPKKASYDSEVEVTHFYVQPIEDKDFPPDAFNDKKLIEGAQVKTD